MTQKIFCWFDALPRTAVGLFLIAGAITELLATDETRPVAVALFTGGPESTIEVVRAIVKSCG
ncbi:hypothetical protein [Streptomyces sp. NPDC093149]|uniref:hypothetical protein n=1 Tax=Streptomyces sp. NPDC093149 TaxID=3366031 RepID=UPI00382AF846